MLNPQSVNPLDLPSLPLSDRKSFPSISCIYFALSNGTVQYIGRAKNLNQRWLNHHRLIQLQSLDTAIAYLECPESLLDDVEQALIKWFKPPLNRSVTPKEHRIPSPNKIGVPIPKDLLEWFQGYCESQERSISAQVVFMIRQLKQREESGK